MILLTNTILTLIEIFLFIFLPKLRKENTQISLEQMSTAKDQIKNNIENKEQLENQTSNMMENSTRSLIFMIINGVAGILILILLITNAFDPDLVFNNSKLTILLVIMIITTIGNEFESRALIKKIKKLNQQESDRDEPTKQNN